MNRSRVHTPTQNLARSELEEKEPAVSYLNVVADRSGRFAAAVVLRGGNVGIVGWAGNAPICDTCVGGEHSQRRGCGHARAFAEHVTKEKGAIVASLATFCSFVATRRS